MNDDEFLVLFELRAIPQRNAHYMILHGEAIKTADRLVELGLVVKVEAGSGDQCYRLNKMGRDLLLLEWDRRGQPKQGEAWGTK